MDSEDPTCTLLTAALAATQAGAPLAASLLPLVRHIDDCARCRTRGRLRVALSPRALELALPLRGQALRGEGEDVFVLFDGSGGDPPRQLTIVVRRAGAGACELRVTAEPPLAGVLLVTIGVLNFAGRFREDGSATIAGIPEPALDGAPGPGLEIAILPYDT